MLSNALKSMEDFNILFKEVKEMNLPLFITKHTGEIIFANDSFSELTEYDSLELLGKNPKIFKSNYHDQSFYKLLWNTLLSGNIWRGEIFNKTKTGKLIWNTMVIIPIKDFQGNILYFLSIRENINVYKDLNRFISIENKLFSNSPIVLFNYDLSDSNSTYISNNVKHITSYSSKEIIDQSVFNIIHPSDLKRVKGEINYNIRSINSNYFMLNFRVLQKNNRISYLTGKINLIKDRENKILRAHGYFLDITRQKKLEKDLHLSENKFEIAMNNIGYGIWDWDIETGKVFYSKNWKTMLGFDEYENFTDISTWESLLHPDDKERIMSVTHKLLNKEIPIYEQEYRLKTKSGVYKWVLSRGKALEWHEGEATRVIGIHIDITDRKLKEEYEYKSKNLESLGRLAGNIAHNFNNILMNIQGNLELLKTDTIDKESYIKDIEVSIKRAKKLSQKMLIFAKGGDPIKMQVDNLDDIIKERVESLLKKYSHQYKVSYDIDEDLFPTFIDVNLFSEAIDNILSNSVEAMGSSGKLSIQVKNTNKIENEKVKNSDYLCISIKDTGYGIKQSIINKIFEPFFTTLPHKKQGVGLTVVNAIITKHHGHIFIKSIENQGTEVKIYLKATSNTIKRQIKPKKDNVPLHILVMDDESIILNILQKFLTKVGYTVELAKHGEEAIKKYQKAMQEGTPFDLVIMDLIIVNGLGGEETIKELLKLDPSITAIASSGYSNSQVMANYKKYGFKAVLPKPYKLDELKKIVLSVV